MNTQSIHPSERGFGEISMTPKGPASAYSQTVAAIGTIAAVSAVASVAGAAMKANADKKANQATINNARTTNDLNRAMFLEGRGDTGFATLPYYATTGVRSADLTALEAEGAAAAAALDALKAKYAGEPEKRLLRRSDYAAAYNRTIRANEKLVNTRNSAGNGLEPFEPKMFNDLRGVYDEMMKLSPEEQVKFYQERIAPFAASQQASMDLTGSMFDRTLREEEKGYLNEYANAKKAGWMESLQETLGNIDRSMQKKGFTGDSSGKNWLRFDANRKMNTDMADLRAGGEYGINMNDISRKLQNINLPWTMATTAGNFADLPESLAAAKANKAAQLIKANFGLQPAAFQYNPLPAVQPNNTGAAIASGIASSLNQWNETKATQANTDKYIAALRAMGQPASPPIDWSNLTAPITAPSVSYGGGYP